jgi:glycerate dehydrogenase
MNIVVLDSDNLAGDADFPEVALQKYGWLQYVETNQELVGERCWRSDIIVTVSTMIDRAVIDKAFKLKLIIAAGGSYDHIDLDAARERGIKVCNVPDSAPAKTEDTGRICQQVVDIINAFLQGAERNLVPEG